jgi:homocysteine S-methyltransferase
MTVIVDGGLSTALNELGHDLIHPLWTARLLSENPAAIVAAHTAFLDAGAEVLITSSYQASFDGFVRIGATTDEARTLLQRTTDLARQAARGRSAVVAASVGPYGAVLADGSEYRGDYALSNGELVVFHRDRVRLLAETEPDWWACETIPTAAEAVAMGLALAAVRRLPTWMTFTCQSGSHTCGGDRIEDAVAAATSACELSAVGVNCTAPALVPELLARIRRVTDLPLFG